jgi:hypothetical protein
MSTAKLYAVPKEPYVAKRIMEDSTSYGPYVCTYVCTCTYMKAYKGRGFYKL